MEPIHERPTVCGTSVVELASTAGIVFQMFCSRDAFGHNKDRMRMTMGGFNQRRVHAALS